MPGSTRIVVGDLAIVSRRADALRDLAIGAPQHYPLSIESVHLLPSRFDPTDSTPPPELLVAIEARRTSSRAGLFSRASGHDPQGRGLSRFSTYRSPPLRPLYCKKWYA